MCKSPLVLLNLIQEKTRIKWKWCTRINFSIVFQFLVYLWAIRGKEVSFICSWVGVTSVWVCKQFFVTVDQKNTGIWTKCDTNAHSDPAFRKYDGYDILLIYITVVLLLSSFKWGFPFVCYEIGVYFQRLAYTSPRVTSPRPWKHAMSAQLIDAQISWGGESELVLYLDMDGE